MTHHTDSAMKLLLQVHIQYMYLFGLLSVGAQSILNVWLLYIVSYNTESGSDPQQSDPCAICTEDQVCLRIGRFGHRTCVDGNKSCMHE